MENRLEVHYEMVGKALPVLSVASYTYDGDGLKRRELVDGTPTTLIWDGSDYLHGRS